MFGVLRKRYVKYRKMAQCQMGIQTWNILTGARLQNALLTLTECWQSSFVLV
jgi:hypothetical protein